MSECGIVLSIIYIGVLHDDDVGDDVSDDDSEALGVSNGLSVQCP